LERGGEVEGKFGGGRKEVVGGLNGREGIIGEGRSDGSATVVRMSSVLGSGMSGL
jgi:hypothetical protein